MDTTHSGRGARERRRSRSTGESRAARSARAAAPARLNTASGARRVCAMARDILGGNGMLLGHHVARHHADVEAVYTCRGTDGVRSLIVGRLVSGLSGRLSRRTGGTDRDLSGR
jgi:alkylation response protein AidB-like acyl-CoA dehydrogenase